MDKLTEDALHMSWRDKWRRGPHYPSKGAIIPTQSDNVMTGEKERAAAGADERKGQEKSIDV
jgi:hypothetical protein